MGCVLFFVISYFVNGLFLSVFVDSSCNESFYEKLYLKGKFFLRESLMCFGDLYGFLCRNLLNDDINCVF